MFFSLNDMTDFSNFSFDEEFKNLTLILDKTYGTDSLGIYHIFREERVLVDCVRFYNAIWSVRQNLNLYIANLVKDTTEFSVSWGDIFNLVKNSKKIKQKNFVHEHVPFLDYVKQINYDFSIAFDGTICRYEPKIEVHFDAPYAFGKPKNSTYEIFSDYFMSFFCFWYVYTSQALMVTFNHNIFRGMAKAVNSFRYLFTFKMSFESKEDRNVLIQSYDMNQEMFVITINRMYQKFFAG